MTAPAVRVRHAGLNDALVAPMLSELAEDYYARYRNITEIRRYPAAEFAPPHGALLVLVENGAAVAGGAFRYYEPGTAELKRVWAHSAQRRRGLGRRVLAELEAVAAGAGYRKLYLTTGPKQPEACGLYLVTGYTPLFDPRADPASLELLAFEKTLPTNEIPRQADR